jgi:hypothetical protein
MSSTNRGRTRNRKDNYPTPKWAVRRLFEAVQLPIMGDWLEPCAGDGAIIRAVDEICRKDQMILHPIWTALEIREKACEKLKALDVMAQVFVHHGDALKLIEKDGGKLEFSVCITNPPFLRAKEFIEACIPICGHVVMLLRLNFLSSQERYELMTHYTPDIYILPNRPSFFRKRVLNKKTKKLSKKPRDVTDSIEYAWFHFHPNASGKWQLLNQTPAEERKLR